MMCLSSERAGTVFWCSDACIYTDGDKEGCLTAALTQVTGDYMHVSTRGTCNSGTARVMSPVALGFVAKTARRSTEES